MQQATQIVYVTPQGYEQLQQQLKYKQLEYTQICQHRQVAFELSGDGWHDNPEFNRMQQLEANLNHMVKKLSERLQFARIVEINDAMRSTQQVAIGSVVEINRYALQGNDEMTEIWEIVGFDETNLAQAQLAYNAPLAQAIIGLQVGELAEELQLGSKLWEIEVVKFYPNRRAANM